MSSNLKKIEAPIFMVSSEIKQHFWENWLLISNLQGSLIPDGGGIVRYVADKSRCLYEKKAELDSQSEIYGNTIVICIGDKGNTVGGGAYEKHRVPF